MKLKYFFIVSSLFLASLNIQAQSKVGTVNIDLILSKMPELTQVQHMLDKYGKELSSAYEDKIASYKVKIEKYKEGETTNSDVMKKTLQQEIIALENDINKFKNNGVKLTQIRKDELLRPLYQKISDMVQTVAKEQNYSQILTTDGNEFAYADEKFDITKTVMNKLGLKTE
ncbi:OmpH family outer membrane protein [Pseudofulvibacter geojedonensis]|uniref:OmpH family outer membrane protein n=1 Tax=Pseudofulvibacter geojedonensis TaxID=1123758 RepID=A0ABW3I3L4_9FLAO